MKKYIAPTTKVVLINCQNMIAGSLGFGNTGSDAGGAESNGFRAPWVGNGFE